MPERHPWLLPVVIVLAGALLGGTLYFVRGGSTATSRGDLSVLRPVNTSDHIVGNPDAPVVIVEYSDIDCAYCKQFRETLEQLMTDYANTGQVAWVYRHFPVIESHPYAAEHAEAAECAASLGGSTMFFRFIDAMNQAAPRDEQYDPKNYGTLASSLGLSADELTKCAAGTKFEKRVADDFDNAVAIGANGTPYSVILIKGSEPIPVSGALPYPALAEVVKKALAKATAN